MQDTKLSEMCSQMWTFTPEAFKTAICASPLNIYIAVIFGKQATSYVLCISIGWQYERYAIHTQ